ncbi:MAG: hypothetical protein DYG94_13690 [Leptolyngbya sp. PLA3]|nr:MAG: hypothetical protein EDM82_14245 [Cyanobacteria bacterium CYA]MCE7969779.1 hypothetical protein [Leptolyngbya sp. PL-A3]
MRGSGFILSAVAALAAAHVRADVVFPFQSVAEVTILPHGVHPLDAGGVALGAVRTMPDRSRTPNLNSLGDLLVLDYQSVAIDGVQDGVQLSVLTSDVRRDLAQEAVATRFFVATRYLWQGAAEVSTNPAPAYDLPIPRLDLSAPAQAEPSSLDSFLPHSPDVLDPLSLIGFAWN